MLSEHSLAGDGYTLVVDADGAWLDLDQQRRAELKKLLDIALNIEPRTKPEWANWLADRL